jgi:serine phosphatase RsbU (regulator of sigma subunit)
MPVGVEMGGGFKEGEARLEPGDLLLVSSDGLVEREQGTLALEELASELEPTEGAAEALEHLLERAADAPIDDVTVLVLHRLGT